MSTNKKVAILCFVDSTDEDKALLQTIEDTYVERIIDDELDGFSFYSCVSMTDEEITNAHHKHVGTYNSDEVMVYVPVKAENSFKKLQCVIKTIHNALEGTDYILITNTKTFLNVEMLYQFINSLNDNDETIYCSRVKTSKTYSGPYENCVFPDCNACLIPLKYYFEVLMKSEYRNLAEKMDENKSVSLRYSVMDYMIGLLIDSYLIDLQKEHSSYYRNWNHSKFSDLEYVEDLNDFMSIDFNDSEELDISAVMNNVNTELNKTTDFSDVLNAFFSDSTKHVIYDMDADEEIEYSQFSTKLSKKNNGGLTTDDSLDTYWKWFNIYSYCPYWINSTHCTVAIYGSSMTVEDLEKMKYDVETMRQQVLIQNMKLACQDNQIAEQREYMINYMAHVEELSELVDILAEAVKQANFWSEI